MPEVKDKYHDRDKEFIIALSVSVTGVSLPRFG
jgi:hypothetical protein